MLSRTDTITKALLFGALVLVPLYVLTAFGSFDSQDSGDQGPNYQAAEPLIFDIEKEADVVIHGVNTVDQSGSDLVVADLNGNGIDDVAIAVEKGDLDGEFDVGGTYVFFDGLAPGVSSLSTADLKIKGPDVASLLASSLAVGDLNNDGVADIAIGGAEFTASTDLPTAGVVHVMFGPVGTGTRDLSDSSDVVFNSAERVHLGAGLAIADLNNDGFDDLAMAAPKGHEFSNGLISIFFGPIESGEIMLPDEVDATLHGANSNDQAGTRMTTGDVNGDGIVDLVVGAPFADPGGLSAAGEAYVIFGPLPAGDNDVSAVADITIRGVETEAQAGDGLAVGDLNGDGINELIVSAIRASEGSQFGMGKVYVFTGPVQPGTMDLQSSPDITIVGEISADRLGKGVAVGDVNSDGVNDLVMTAPFTDPASVGDSAGTTYAIYGNIYDRVPTPEEAPVVPIVIGVVAVLVIIGIVAFFIWMKRKPAMPQTVR